MRIAYFTEVFPSKSETWVHHEIKKLQDLGHDVRVYSTWPKPKEIVSELKELCNITIYLNDIGLKGLFKNIYLIFKPSVFRKVWMAFLFDCKGIMQRGQVIRDIGIILMILDEVNNYNPDFIYAHFAASRANLAFLYKILTGIPYVIKIHALDVFNRPAMLNYKVRECLRVFSISHYNIEYLKRNVPTLDFSKFNINRCGLPLKNYPFTYKEFGKNPLRLVSVGRLVKMKGFDILIKALSVIINEMDICLAIVGDGPEKKSLGKLIEKLGLKEQVQLKNYCSPSEVKSILQSSSIFVLPCRYDVIDKTQDGIPVALMEAMALGIPVISSNISGIPELITNNKEGFLIEPENPKLLACTILEILNKTEDELYKITRAARIKIENEFDVNKLAEQLSMEISPYL